MVDRNSRRRRVRLNANDESVVAEAAALTGATFSGFVRAGSVARAGEIVDAQHNIRLADHAYDSLLTLLDAPAAPCPDLVELAHHAQRFQRRS
jgi:uncharacterized protein (DUF1778 family)